MSEQGFPNIGREIADPQTGLVTLAWRQFFVNLWNRTGGGTDIIRIIAPPGSLMVWAGSINPPRTLDCDGSAVSRATYAALFAAIGTTWGAGDGSTTFNVPDYRGRTIIGADGTYSLGTSGGVNDVTLTTAQLPTHNHGVTDPGHTHTFTGTAHGHTVTDPGHTHNVPAANSPIATAQGFTQGNSIIGSVPSASATTGITIANTTAGGTNASATTGISTQNTGSGDPITILPPYAAARVLIRT
jgi:microcystin-dependent protein